MATADQLRAQHEQNRQALRQALESFGGDWTAERPEEEWPPKRVAEHAIGAEVYFANHVSTAMLGKPGEWERSEIDSPSAAVERLDAAAAIADRAYKYVEDRDLGKRVEAEGVPDTIEGVMELANSHLTEHAQQLGQTA